MNPYAQAFYLEKEEGNNALAFKKRSSPRLYVPSLREGALEDVRAGKEVVFADEDEHGVMQECVGLEALIRTEWEGVPMVIVDNHNHVFYFWAEAFLKAQLGAGAYVVHVDGHKDMRRPPEPYRGKNLEDAFAYTNFVLNVGNYIVPAMEAGFVKEVQFVTSESALEDREFFGKTPKILNLDLDFFAPELSYINFKTAKDFIVGHAREASLITISTSPFFIDQARALGYLQRIFGTKPC